MKDNVGWLGKYFVCDGLENNSFIMDFKSNISNFINEKEIYYERLYSNSDSLLFYPKKNITKNGKSILLVSHELSRTGAPVVTLDTAKVLTNNGYFVTVISLSEGPLLEEFLDIGVPVVIMPDLKRIQYFKNESFQFFPKMDLDVFVNNFDITIMVTATLFNFVRRYFNLEKKIIWWIHEGSVSYEFLNVFMPKFITPNIKVVCGGEYAVKQLKQHGYHYYPTVLNYGVFDDSKLYKRKPRKDNKIRFLLAGSVGIRKGQLDLLDAIKELPSKYKDLVEFIFVGEPYEGDIIGIGIMNDIKNFSLKNNCVKIYKNIVREKLYELYETIDVLVLASLDDPMPVVATENFMLSNACLCSSNTGTSYYIEDGVNGFVFEAGNSKKLLEKIIYIVDNRDKLNDIRKRGRKIFDDYFDMKVFERNIIKLIEEKLL